MKNALMCAVLITCGSSSSCDQKLALQETTPRLVKNGRIETYEVWRLSDDLDKRAYSVLHGSTINLFPSNIKLSVPKKWIDLNERGPDSKLLPGIYSSPKELESVAQGDGNNIFGWYASFCNRVFPFDRCAFSAGPFPWNAPYDGTHFRVYDLKDTLDEVTRTISEKGQAEITRLTGKKAMEVHGKRDDWTKASFEFDWRDDDASMRVKLNCYSREFKKQSIVFCFLNCGESDDIVGSVVLPK